MPEASLSILTINYNNRDGLKRTIRSVESQETAPYEFIVIDGGSTDGSVDVIRAHASSISYWVSEPDKGIFNAMNKGVQVATGQYVLFINSGDTLYDRHVVSKVMSILSQETAQFAILSGHVARYRGGVAESFHFATPRPNLFHMLVDTLPHQGTIVTRALHLEYPFDEHMKIAADHKFFFQALILRDADKEESDPLSVQYRFIDSILAKFECGGISDKNPELLSREWQEYIFTLFPPRIYHACITSASVHGASMLLSKFDQGFADTWAQRAIKLALKPLRLRYKKRCKKFAREVDKQF